MTPRPRARHLLVFAGPSLPARDARSIAPCTVLPPARQGDIWRALPSRPAAIALVDGLFESAPSVWHHEILAALDAGVAVFGGASMGALRAAELSRYGMVGVGRIHGWYRDGVIRDDAEVALLHTGPDHGWRPLTVPLVNVRHAAEGARAARVLSAREARGLVEAAAGIFYQERTWERIVTAAARRWRGTTRARFERWSRRGLEDLKRIDARATVSAAAAFVAARNASGQSREAPALSRPSSLVRRRRLWDGRDLGGGPFVAPPGRVMEALRRRADAGEMERRGLSRAILAGVARSMGMVASREAIRRAETTWLARAGVPRARRDAFLAASGLDEGEARRLCEEMALEALVLEHASRLLPDGPSADEGLAAEARVRGAWAEAARRLARGGPGLAATARRRGARSRA